ncbi:hypothetical protein [Bailinhaonella thermotolerans]|uniref:Uncharacterized protein n=1 Tax=Bailinhaonella thermotolerans TaxID=1070861 RepID=A0A3A4A629_9ACTN|nr:hypothetical protein [Bailinhaonella thermotolerans]RJL21103.1 hypothetical protein D5H75_38480 [Bailinhaonella thermotolerans]
MSADRPAPRRRPWGGAEDMLFEQVLDTVTGRMYLYCTACCRAHHYMDTLVWRYKFAGPGLRPFLRRLGLVPHQFHGMARVLLAHHDCIMRLAENRE